MEVENESKLHNYAYDPFQVEAIKCIDNDENVLITAHTGCGKTAIAEHAIWRTLRNTDKKVIFTSPIKALSNEKYYDWQRKLEAFGIEAEDLGLLTGDIKVNPDARLVIMTAEILHNMNLEEMADIATVVMDEVHWVSDPDRGKVWEGTLLKLPQTVQVVLLSATIDKPEKFAGWIEKVRDRKTHAIATDYRVVPLKHFIIAADNLHQTYEAKQPFDFDTFTRIKEDGYSSTHRLNKAVELLVRKNKAPVIFFCMSRKNCEKYARQVRVVANTHEERREIEIMCFNLLKKYPEVRELAVYRELTELFNKGIAFHHSGMIPILKELVEMIYKQGLIKVLFATETLAVGVNMPTRTVVFTQLEKPTERGRRTLTPAEFTQMAGRAGRRGHDKVGHVVFLPLDDRDLVTGAEYKDLLHGKAAPVRSQLQIDLQFVLGHLDKPNAMARSMSFEQNQDRLNGLKIQLDRLNLKDSHKISSNMEEYMRLDKQANPELGSMIRISANQRRKILKKMGALKRQIPDFDKELELFDKFKEDNNMRQQLKDAIEVGGQQYQDEWNACVEQLIKYDFAEKKEGIIQPTQKGNTALCFPDGMPLVMGTVVSMPEFSKLSMTEICMWISLFINPCCKKGEGATTWKAAIPNCPETLSTIFEKTQNCVPEHDFVWEMPQLVQIWCDNKDFIKVAERLETCRLGDFIKGILRICNFLDQVKNACAIRENYDSINLLDDHMDKLFSGVVTNNSLYITT